MGSIGKTTTPCQCHMFVASGKMNFSACRDTQTFELAVMQKFFLLNNFGSGGWLDLQDYDNLSVPCASAFRTSTSRASMRHPDIRITAVMKFFSC